jgi:hypothetical protein
MGKIRKFAELNIRKIVGGKDPVRVVEDFIVRRGFEPSKCLKEKDLDQTRWMIRIKDEKDLEILVESARKPQETTIYMGVNIITVPIRGSHDVLAAALEIADGLVGIKVSLVGHYLVLSASMSAQGVTIDELDYNFRLIEAQQTWFRDALATELQWDQFPLD